MPTEGMTDEARPLIWRDSLETAHACDAINLRQAFLLLRTRCGRNVPPNARWPRQEHSAITCPECRRSK